MTELLSHFTGTLDILLVLIVTAAACALIGNFLVLRQLSMVSDAISHTVLLGIVIAFFITKRIDSPLLIVGAGLFGIITVLAIESLSNTGLVKNDDAVGIIFPLFFALAVILITKFARNVHLDVDVVLMGEVILAPINRVELLGLSMPKALLEMGLMCLVNLLFILVFFKELKVSTFDQEFATISGFSAVGLFYALMSLSSFTAVIAFDAVGAILVVSFLITPAASSYLITKDLKHMICLSLFFSVINSCIGYILGIVFNVSISGATALAAGFSFLLTFLFARGGLVRYLIDRRHNRQEFHLELLLMHIGNHSGQADEDLELGRGTIQDHLAWSEEEINSRLEELMARKLVYIYQAKDSYRLSPKGKLQYEIIKEEYGM